MRSKTIALLSAVLATAMIVGPVVAKMTPSAPPKARLAKVRRLYAEQSGLEVADSGLACHGALEALVEARSHDAALTETRSTPGHQFTRIVRYEAALVRLMALARQYLQTLPGGQFSSGISPIRC